MTFKIGLTEFPWESMRSKEEIIHDDDEDRHNEGYCEGAPDCWVCQELKEQNEKIMRKFDGLVESFKK